MKITYAELRAKHFRINYSYSLFPRQVEEWVSKGDLDLNPEYQRDHVWTKEQSSNYIGFRLEGGLVQNIIGRRKPDGRGESIEIIDGKQRLWAIVQFVRGEIPAMLSDGTALYLREFNDQDQSMLLGSMTLRTEISIVELGNEKDVWSLYYKLNKNGTVHSADELDRVKQRIETWGIEPT